MPRENAEVQLVQEPASDASTASSVTALAVTSIGETEQAVLQAEVAPNDRDLPGMFASACARIRELSNVLIRAEETYVAKLIYEALHPEARQGGAPGAPGGGKKAKTATVASFAEAIGEATCRSARAVRLDVEIVTRLEGDVAARLRDSAIATQTTLLHAISRMPSERQLGVVAKYESARARGGEAAAEQALKAAIREASPPLKPRLVCAPLLDRVRFRIPTGGEKTIDYAGRVLRIVVTSVDGNGVARVGVEVVEAAEE